MLFQLHLIHCWVTLMMGDINCMHSGEITSWYIIYSCQIPLELHKWFFSFSELYQAAFRVAFLTFVAFHDSVKTPASSTCDLNLIKSDRLHSGSILLAPLARSVIYLWYWMFELSRFYSNFCCVSLECTVNSYCSIICSKIEVTSSYFGVIAPFVLLFLYVLL